MTTSIQAGPHPASEIDSSYAWLRLAVALLLGTIGSVGMWSFVVALPAVQADFGVARADASLPYTLAMIGFGGGGVLMGRLADRFGIVVPVIVGALAARRRLLLSGVAGNLWQFALAHVLIGFGSSATFGPLIADISHWFTRRRGIAVAIASCGNYLAGAIWPPIVQHFIATDGWRADPDRHRHRLRRHHAAARAAACAAARRRSIRRARAHDARRASAGRSASRRTR